ncbi:hypothetical protein [Agromyces sp. SYSU T00194]|uniref:hypothetical protein n=1 Tax=Agromyces chitinivorans TaxID=3158560 RepID=UPI003399E5C3
MPFALVLTAVLFVLAVFQFALVIGAPLGHFAWGGRHRVLPARLRVGSAVSIVVYAFIVAIAWDRVGLIDVFGAQFSEVAMWVVFGYLALGILMNAVSRSVAERALMVPVSIVLAGCSLLIALGYGELATAA